jgi:hypothetical protein
MLGRRVFGAVNSGVTSIQLSFPKIHKVTAWLKRHSRFHGHFIPTSSSWLNMVERWLREITDQRIRRGTFWNVSALIEAIKNYIGNHNQNP